MIFSSPTSNFIPSLCQLYSLPQFLSIASIHSHVSFSYVLCPHSFQPMATCGWEHCGVEAVVSPSLSISLSFSLTMAWCDARYSRAKLLTVLQKTSGLVSFTVQRGYPRNSKKEWNLQEKGRRRTSYHCCLFKIKIIVITIFITIDGSSQWDKGHIQNTTLRIT